MQRTFSSFSSLNSNKNASSASPTGVPAGDPLSLSSFTVRAEADAAVANRQEGVKGAGGGEARAV